MGLCIGLKWFSVINKRSFKNLGRSAGQGKKGRKKKSMKKKACMEKKMSELGRKIWLEGTGKKQRFKNVVQTSFLFSSCFSSSITSFSLCICNNLILASVEELQNQTLNTIKYSSVHHLNSCYYKKILVTPLRP